MLLFGGITAIIIILTTPSEFNPMNWDTYHRLPYVTTVDVNKSRRDAELLNELDEINGIKVDHNGMAEIPIKPLLQGYDAPVNEHFINGGSTINSVQPYDNDGPDGLLEVIAHPYSGSALPDYTPPTSRNLFMNVLVDEIKYNPDKKEAAQVDGSLVKQTLDDYFRIQWFSDPTDVFGKNQSQRQFVTQPSTTVPNDQGSFADWLYKIPGKTCKEGGREACLAGTDGGAVTWLNQKS
jgi:hypothetical protein